MRWSIGFQRCGWGHCVSFLVIIPILSKGEKVLSYQSRRGRESERRGKTEILTHSPPLPLASSLFMLVDLAETERTQEKWGKLTDPPSPSSSSLH